MKKRTQFTLGTLASLLISTQGMAGELTIPNIFSSGTPAVAAEVNANFDTIETEVDDNNERINTNAANIQSNTDMMPGIAFTNENTCCTDIPTTTITKQSITLNAPGPGYAVVTYTGLCSLFHVNGPGLNQRIRYAISTSPDISITESRKAFLVSRDAADGTYTSTCSTQAVYPVTGSTTFYLNANSVLPREGEAATMGWGNFHALFIPNLYQ